jgi:probable F420-dependent oxidoreductase
MQIGFGVPVSGSWASPERIQEVSRTAERLGYASLWSFQRLLYPAHGDPIPMPYRSVHDPLAVAAYLAGVTDRIRIGIAIVNLPFYAPAVLAKTLTSIDVLSGGRLDAGLGLGWSPDEFAAAGADLHERGARAEEFVATLRAIWTDDPVEVHGRYYQVPRSHVDPKPVQRPHPPLLLGAASEPALRRIGRVADGWVSASRFPATAVADAIAAIRDEAAKHGRDPAGIRIVIRAAVRVRDEDSEQQLTGSIDKIRGDIDAYRNAGATELFVDLNFDEQIGDPAADPAASMRRAHEALEAFAPGA